MALTKDRNTPTRVGEEFVVPVAAATTIYAGSLGMMNASGYALPGDEATGQVCLGRAEERVVNGGSAGDVSCRFRSGVFQFGNSAGGDEITIADVGADCWIVDDQTVAKTSAEVEGNPTRSVAGKIVGVDAGGVWVRCGL